MQKWDYAACTAVLTTVMAYGLNYELLAEEASIKTLEAKLKQTANTGFSSMTPLSPRDGAEGSAADLN